MLPGLELTDRRDSGMVEHKLARLSETLQELSADLPETHSCFVLGSSAASMLWDSLMDGDSPDKKSDGEMLLNMCGIEVPEGPCQMSAIHQFRFDCIEGPDGSTWGPSILLLGDGDLLCVDLERVEYRFRELLPQGLYDRIERAGLKDVWARNLVSGAGFGSWVGMLYRFAWMQLSPFVSAESWIWTVRRMQVPKEAWI